MIVAFPADTPDTTPVALIVAVPEALLVQIPPVGVLLKVIEPPIQVVNVPVVVIGVTIGGALTTTTAVVEFVQALFTPLATV